MGPELSLILGGLGTYAGVRGQQVQADRRNRILNDQLTRTGQVQDKAAQQVLNEGANYSPDKRMADMQAQEQATYDRSLSDLGPVASGIVDAAGDKGAGSADFIKAKADSAITEGNRITALARELAKTRAPGQLMTAEGMRRANLTGELSNQFSSNRNMGEAASLDAQNVEEPWWGQLGKVGQAVGMSMAGNSFGAPAMPPTSADSGIDAWDSALKRAPRIKFG